MAQIGQKRSVSDVDSSTDSDKAKDDATLTSLSKRPATSSSFSFRPSPLQSATKGFALRQSSLQSAVSTLQSSPPVSTPTTSAPTNVDSQSEQSLNMEKSTSGGFLKLNQESLKSVGVSSYSIMGSDGTPVMTTGGTSTAATVSQTRSPFAATDNAPVSFKSSTESSSSPRENYFAAASNQTPSFVTPTSSSSDNGTAPTNQAFQEGASPSSNLFPEGSRSSPQSDKGEDEPVFGQNRQPLLPEVHAFTGEEREKNIVLISAKLYVFEGDTRTWKDRGRGEIRLNDSAKDEGVFQSRLVMRASGTYRVLLNTHLWSQMSCDRANQKSIRVTAQHINSTQDVGVYLITGAAKDIQQLFTAIDRRIQALKRNVGSGNSDKPGDHPDSTTEPVIPDDEEDKEDSRQSSPDSSPEVIRVRPIERERPPVLSVQRSNSSEPAADSGVSSPECEATNTPSPNDNTEKASSTSEHTRLT